MKKSLNKKLSDNKQLKKFQFRQARKFKAKLQEAYIREALTI